MDKIQFFITDDLSIGLYSEKDKDIFHSKTGALKEAFDKFIIPSGLVNYVDSQKPVKILDICTGIGYNLKSALTCLENRNAQIDCIEIEKDYIMLIPFIFDKINNFDLKVSVLDKILKSGIDFNILYECVNSYIYKNDIYFFDRSMINFMHFIKNSAYDLCYQALNYSNLHNIYYNYISNNNINSQNINKYNDININFFFDDARKIVIGLNEYYDIIFLDAFSPQKNPVLWTIDFLSLIKSKMNFDSILVSYSKSTPFRSALKELGFFIGKTYVDGVDMGTVASLNKRKIKNPLISFDLELIKTRSGIVYRDPDLSDIPSQIIKRREIEQKFSSRISHTAFLKKITE